MRTAAAALLVAAATALRTAAVSGSGKCDYRSTDGSRCYALADSGGGEATHGEAVRLCAADGGTLPVVDSKQVGERLDEIMAEEGVDRLWVDGTTKEGRSSRNRDDWVLSNGTTIPHELWAAVEPNAKARHESTDPELCINWQRGKGMEDWPCETYGNERVLCQRTDEGQAGGGGGGVASHSPHTSSSTAPSSDRTPSSTSRRPWWLKETTRSRSTAGRSTRGTGPTGATSGERHRETHSTGGTGSSTPSGRTGRTRSSSTHSIDVWPVWPRATGHTSTNSQQTTEPTTYGRTGPSSSGRTTASTSTSRRPWWLRETTTRGRSTAGGSTRGTGPAGTGTTGGGRPHSTAHSTVDTSPSSSTSEKAPSSRLVAGGSGTDRTSSPTTERTTYGGRRSTQSTTVYLPWWLRSTTTSGRSTAGHTSTTGGGRWRSESSSERTVSPSSSPWATGSRHGRNATTAARPLHISSEGGVSARSSTGTADPWRRTTSRGRTGTSGSTPPYHRRTDTSGAPGDRLSTGRSSERTTVYVPWWKRSTTTSGSTGRWQGRSTTAGPFDYTSEHSSRSSTPHPRRNTTRGRTGTSGSTRHQGGRTDTTGGERDRTTAGVTGPSSSHRWPPVSAVTIGGGNGSSTAWPSAGTGSSDHSAPPPPALCTHSHCLHVIDVPQRLRGPAAMAAECYRRLDGNATLATLVDTAKEVKRLAVAAAVEWLGRGGWAWVDGVAELRVARYTLPDGRTIPGQLWMHGAPKPSPVCGSECAVATARGLWHTACDNTTVRLAVCESPWHGPKPTTPADPVVSHT